METFVFLVAAAICLAGALGVVLSTNPVHSALSLVGTLFGVAVLFVAQNADFLAAVQVIIYAGAIVVLFLFVIMLLGVDRAEDLKVDPLIGQRAAGIVVGVAIFALPVAALAASGWDATGAVSNLGPVRGQRRPRHRGHRPGAVHPLHLRPRDHVDPARHRRGRRRDAGQAQPARRRHDRRPPRPAHPGRRPGRRRRRRRPGDATVDAPSEGGTA